MHGRRKLQQLHETPSCQVYGLQQEELKKIAMEIATEGRSGFDVNTPTKQYQLKTLPGEFSGLEMVCYLYVVMQMMAPGTDIGFDLSREYEAARCRK